MKCKGSVGEDMLQIGLVLHSKRKETMDYAKHVAASLKLRGIKVCSEDEFSDELGVVSFSETEQADIVLSLGGDGTLLRGMQYAFQCEAALLGINMGRIGFLTEAEPDHIETVLDAVISGEYQVEERPVLHVEANGQHWHSLNDVVLSRGGQARLTTINAWVDDELAGRFVADGVVVATPTGSTGYSLSAGGPIISPRVECMVITPICAHTLQHRPTIVDGNARIVLELCQEDQQSASLQVDGRSCMELTSGVCARIRMDSRRIKLIRMREQHFFQLVRDKLTEWTR